jgi:hypothetical protein
MQVSIPDRKAKYTPSGKLFIALTQDEDYIASHLSRSQLRVFANKILKELDRK